MYVHLHVHARVRVSLLIYAYRFEYKGVSDGRACHPGVGAALLLLAEKYEHVRTTLHTRPVSLPFSAACTGEALVSMLSNADMEQEFDRYTNYWEFPRVIPPAGLDEVSKIYMCISDCLCASSNSCVRLLAPRKQTSHLMHITHIGKPCVI